MSIRSAAKAIIIRDGMVLLNKCFEDDLGSFYTLPGGGQNKYESLHDAVIRECLEETGYMVRPIRLAAVAEEIWIHPDEREKYPNHSHMVHHIFICEAVNETAATPTEIDMVQVGCEWIALNCFHEITFYPQSVYDNFLNIINSTAPVFLGTAYYND